MKKCVRRIGICCLVAALAWGSLLIKDHQQLRNELIRIHVVANSDSREDQALKLQVRDAVVNSLSAQLRNVADVQQAKMYIQEKLPRLRQLAEDALRAAGCEDGVRISLEDAFFEKREYDSVSLPAGIYNALRITIGEGAGQNWWCVAFPVLWSADSGEEVREITAGAGFPERLSDTLTEGYTIRFACLDALGRLENMLFPG